MTISRRLPPLLVACVVPLALAAGCATDAELQGNEASITERPCDAPGKLDAGDETASKLDAGHATPTEHDAGGQESQPDSKLQIKAITASGSGCPAGSWAGTIQPDASLVLESYGLSYTSGKPTLQSTACTISVSVDAPKGLSWGVTSVEYTGDAKIDPSVKAELSSTIAFTGIGTTANSASRNLVTESGPFAIRDEYAEPSLWAPCDITSNLQIRTRLTLTASAASKGGVEFHLKQVGKIRFATKRCPDASKVMP